MFKPVRMRPADSLSLTERDSASEILEDISTKSLLARNCITAPYVPSGEEVEVFGVGVGQWCWEGVNCDPERPGLAASKEMLVEARVEKSTSLQNYYCVTLQKNGLDSDWWAVYDSNDRKDCESVAEQINKAFERFGLTK